MIGETIVARIFPEDAIEDRIRECKAMIAKANRRRSWWRRNVTVPRLERRLERLIVELDDFKS